MHVGGIFCDLPNAFDYVDHEILLVQLRNSMEFEMQLKIGSDAM